MTIRYTCEGCGASLTIAERLAGTEGHCPQCRAAFVVPLPSGAAVLAAASADAGPADSPPSVNGSWDTDEDLAAALLMDSVAPLASGRTGEAAPRHIRHTCQACGSHLTIRPDRAGTEGRCPKCRARFTVPALVDQPDEAKADQTATELESTTAVESAPLEGVPPRKTRRGAIRADDTQVATATMASALLKRHTHSESESQTSSLDEPPRRKSHDKDRIDWAELAKALARQALPGLAGIAVACAAVYWLASAVMVGSPERPPLAEVTGTVTLDGEPLAGALVTFRPETDQPGQPPGAESVGWTDPSGHFSLVYIQGLDGAVLGQHRVRINATDARGAEILPAEYHVESTQSVTVDSGSNSFDFPLKSHP